MTENAYTTIASTKSDVYSYGIVLLELITRKKALDDSLMEGTDLVGWVKSVWEETREIDRIVDSCLVDELSDSNISDQVTQVVLVALKCTEKDPGERPTMRDVIKQLVKINATPMTTRRT